MALEAHCACSLVCERHGGLWKSERGVPSFLQPLSSSQVKQLLFKIGILAFTLDKYLICILYFTELFICPDT